MKISYLILIFLSLQFISSIKVGENIKLPEPEKEGGMPLYEALNKRKSQRDFDPNKKIDANIISQALWSCYGLNRPEISKQLKTTPSAKGWYPLLIYLFMENGVYNYTAKNHTVTKILEGDYRAMTGTQDYVANARVNFVMIADFKKKSAMDPDDAHKTRSMYMDTGHCTMGLYLFAASNNMKGVSRAMVDTDKLLELLGLKQGDYVFTLAFSLGY